MQSLQPDPSNSESEALNTSDNGFSLQVPQPPSPRQSLGGDTLRSRADSFNSSNTEETVRSRANSNVSKIHASFEGNDWTVEEALRPDKINEDDFQVANNPFAFSPGQLNKTLNPKSLAAYKALGGLRGLAIGLQTDLVAGLNVDETTVARHVNFEEAKQAAKAPKEPTAAIYHSDTSITHHEVQAQFHDRKRVYGDNRLPAKESLRIWRLFWNAFNDRILIILTIAAVVSLALGLYEALSQTRQSGQGQSLDWVEGVAIEVAVIVVVLVTGLNDYRREKQFVALNAKKEDRQVKAVRSGRSILISVFDVMVGDVLHMESGDSIPADGLLIEGHGLKCDESSATGESDAMRKTAGEDVWMRIEEGTATSKLDPFIISGSKVLEGVGTYLVTSVGVNSSHGKVVKAMQIETEDTPLQVKLAKMANWIGYLGTAAAGLLFVILTVRFLVGLSTNTSTPAMKGSQFLDILIVAITIIVVAVPEGLPVAVTLALSFATKQMLKENNLVRHLRACETMGNATTICSDKTGTLTQNKMKVVAGVLGSKVRFDKDVTSRDRERKVIPFTAAFERLSPAARTLVLQSCAINSTAFEGEDDEGNFTFVGSKTETAILNMAKEQLGMGPVAEERSGVEFIQLIPFDSDRKCMGSVIRLASGTYRLLVKGAAEILLEKVTSEVVDTAAAELQTCQLSDPAKGFVTSTINEFAERSLRTIALLYRDFPEWPPAGAKTLDEDSSMAIFEDVLQQMTLLGVVGIEDPLRDGVSKAVERCQDAGIKVRMVTGDNVMTARAIATQCGVLTQGGLVMEGPKFRQLSDEEMDETLPHLEVLARSSPDDKRILVQRLKHLGETVAVTGDGTNDGPALKLADIGFSMGIAGTEVAKEASAIILMDDNFSSIVKAIMWGRSVNDAVAKFLQFQITVNITAVVLAFVSAVASPNLHSVLSAVQLLWVNLIMDTFAALALATDAPTEKILDRNPSPKRAPLITTNMWKMIIGQAIYQLAVTFVLYFAGATILGYDTSDSVLQTELNTMVFNTFVWMQIFNEFNNRRLDNNFNIFEGVHRNGYFIAINIVMVAGQIMIISIGGQAFQIKRIDAVQWAICILCALPCMLWAVLLRLIPDKYAAALFGFSGKVWGALYDPVAKFLDHFVFSPIAAAWRPISATVLSPGRRFCKRIWAKALTSERERVARGEDKRSADEESSPATSSDSYKLSESSTTTESSLQSPRTPPEVQLLSPPPITLTAA